MITIAIPFYNAEKYLSLAIDSVIKQTYKDWILLLVDDGSTDSSLNIANDYSKQDNRILVFSDGENKNLGYRLNQIPNLVTTEYLARMDADDIMHPQKIEKQMLILLKHPEIDVLGTNSYSIDENNIVFGIRLPETKDVFVKTKEFIHPTIMAKTQWFKNNLYDVDALRIEDKELWYRTNNKFSFYMLTEPLFFYREFADNYYKKYYQANTAKDYILAKYKKDPFWIKYFKDNIIKGKIYQFFNIFGIEHILIKRRASVKILDKKNYENYIDNK